MSKLPKYCSTCGAQRIKKTIHENFREACSSCGKVIYRNPIPVAAAIVVNQNDHLLLVKRKNDPKKGEWCLPMGFAEIGETIQEAALRELKEETGITGKIISLIDAKSSVSSFHGDLLIITFHIQHINGEPAAGDDAEKVAWYSLNKLPPLAFQSNDKAVAIYRHWSN